MVQTYILSVMKSDFTTKYSPPISLDDSKTTRSSFINPRTPRGGGGYHPPWRFSPVTFLMIPIAKIASAYLLLEMGDTF